MLGVEAIVYGDCCQEGLAARDEGYGLGTGLRRVGVRAVCGFVRGRRERSKAFQGLARHTNISVEAGLLLPQRGGGEIGYIFGGLVAVGASTGFRSVNVVQRARCASRLGWHRSDATYT